METEAWHDAIAAITGQAERLVAEPGLWTAVFPLVVVCLCFATPEDFNNLWRFRLEQAMGMLQSPQVRAINAGRLEYRAHCFCDSTRRTMKLLCETYCV